MCGKVIRAGGEYVLDYRLYCIDTTGKFTKSHGIDAKSDDEALALAREMKLPVTANCGSGAGWWSSYQLRKVKRGEPLPSQGRPPNARQCVTRASISATRPSASGMRASYK
jgi:hypothetical protein